MMDFSSKLLENAVYEISQLPGIGKRTALRLALHLLKQPPTQTERLAASLVSLVNEITYCKQCHNISDTEICDICANIHRDSSLLCVVEDVRDVMAIENTGQYNGLYHVLGGAIDPINGVGPDDLRVRELFSRLGDGEVEEVILATDPDVVGEATAAYLTRMLRTMAVPVSRLASGLPVGADLEYADEVTLGRAFEGRRRVED